ncbi:hypothetical protein LY76DRAFT_402412 [Colletotrichum caudatum]|nr:hypothetical protein LY76DRAFT_402412 [Colletotrichum caudatum]
MCACNHSVFDWELVPRTPLICFPTEPSVISTPKPLSWRRSSLSFSNDAAGGEYWMVSVASHKSDTTQSGGADNLILCKSLPFLDSFSMRSMLQDMEKKKHSKALMSH